MADKVKDIAIWRVKYAAYRNKMRKSGKADKVIGFKPWMKENYNSK